VCWIHLNGNKSVYGKATVERVTFLFVSQKGENFLLNDYQLVKKDSAP